MKRVSFDFDDTLTREEVLNYACELIELGVDVWIVTSRHISHWYEVIQVADKIKLPHYRVIFTGGYKKEKVIRSLGFSFHLDDDLSELSLLPFVGVNVNEVGWKNICNDIVKAL